MITKCAHYGKKRGEPPQHTHIHTHTHTLSLSPSLPLSFFLSPTNFISLLIVWFLAHPHLTSSVHTFNKLEGKAEQFGLVFL